MGSLPEQMRSHFRDVYSVLIAAAIDPAGKDRLITQLNSFTKGHTQPQFLFGEDPYGRIMVSLLLPSLNAGFEQDRAHITVLRGTQLFLALCAYRHEHGGQLPKKLEDLVPAYLPKLPADPFAPAGQTFRYRVEKDRWLIWSLGPNQKDDGGQFNWQDPDDREHHEAQCDLIFASDEFEKARARARAQLEKQQQEKAAAAKP
jgi:hypothetical protein